MDWREPCGIQNGQAVNEREVSSVQNGQGKQLWQVARADNDGN